MLLPLSLLLPPPPLFPFSTYRRRKTIVLIESLNGFRASDMLHEPVEFIHLEEGVPPPPLHEIDGEGKEIYPSPLPRVSEEGGGRICIPP